MSDTAERPLTENSASVKAVRQAKARERQTRAEELKDLRWLTSTTQGKRLARRIVTRCRVFTQAEIESTNRVLVNEGKRSIGLWLVAELEAADPRALVEILFTTPTHSPHSPDGSAHGH